MFVAQFVQLVEEDAEYLPAEQLPDTAERPVVAQYDPAGEAEHDVVPVNA